MNPTWLHNPRINKDCTVIAEIGLSHEGSLGMAHAFIDAVATSHADAVKFQTHIAHAESTPSEPWRIKFSTQDATRFDYWHRTEFNEAQWKSLRKHAHDKGLLFLSSPFSIEAIDLLTKVGVDAWKVASGELNDPYFLEAMLKTGLPMIISTGMSTWSEIDEIVEAIQKKECPLAILQCTSMYPTPPEEIGLNVLSEYRERYHCAVGLSDHSGTIYPGLAAATLGAEVLEVHFTLNRQMFGPDVVASLTPEEFTSLARGVRFIESMRKNPTDKSQLSEHVKPLRKLFMKSVVAARFLPKGTILQSADLAIKKPGTGIAPKSLADCLHKRLRRDLQKDELLSMNDLEPSS